MPKLDLRAIHMQREVQSSNHEDNEGETEEEGSYYEEAAEEEEVDSETRKEMF